MSKIGFVGFFDILGYQNIIENNELEAVAKLINDVLIDLPEKAIKKSKWLSGHDGQQGDHFKQLQARVISDSIIIVWPFNEKVSEDWMFTYGTWLFVKYCESLLDFSFENGIPLRGAIDYGPFFLKENCFAGLPLVKTYKLSNRLDFSGCVLSENLFVKCHTIKNLDTLDSYSKSMGFEFLCPMNDSKWEKFFTISWCRKVREISDLRQYVFQSFQGHKKDLPAKVISKIDGTELWLRKRLIHAENQGALDAEGEAN